jgi:flagellar hook protein FlgE
MGFQQGLSGLNASSRALDVVGNNIANSGTVGFKTGSAQFADVFAASLNGAGATPVGIGTKVAAVVQQFTQGNISVTNNPLDLAINGGGFFVVDDGSGGNLYSRNGQFQLNKDGFIVNAQGQELKGRLAVDGIIPTGAEIAPLRLFDPTASLTGPPQATGASTGGLGIQANINLDSREEAIPVTTTFKYADPTTYNTSTATTIYDSLGNPHTYSMYFVKDPALPNTWNTYATVTNPKGAVPPFTDLSAAGTVSLGTLAFDVSGTLVAATVPFSTTLTDAELGYTGAVGTVTPPATSQTFNINFAGSTQYGSSFTVNTMLQDGFASGTLSGFNVGKDGIVLGRFTNGQNTNIGQVVLASFRNPNGLQPLGNNVWARTPDSGEEILGTPASSGQFGPLQSASLEDANVDLTQELVYMITLQRAYQANAQTIKTQDQVLQTLVNLR